MVTVRGGVATSSERGGVVTVREGETTVREGETQ